MQTGFHHVLHGRRHKNTKSEKAEALAKLFDRYAYVMGGMTVLANVPQLIHVWRESDVSGVSPISWIGFLLGSVFWLFYGHLHKAKALIMINGSLIIVQSLIVFRLLFP